MDKKINNFDFDFMPIGQAIKKAREAKKVTAETREAFLSLISAR